MVVSFMAMLAQQSFDRNLTQNGRERAATGGPVAANLGTRMMRWPQGKIRIYATLSGSRRRWLLAITFLLVCLSGCSTEAPVQLADGGELRFSELRGRWLVINYWAEWCAPCRKEIPELNELHNSRDAHGLVVLGVNYDEIVGEKLLEVMEEMDIHFPVLVEDPRERWGYEQPTALPVTVIIGPDGQLKNQLLGPQTLEMLLAEVAHE